MAHDRTSPRSQVAPFAGHGPFGTLTEQEARQLLQEHARSGQSLKAFALSRGLTPQRLSWWKSKFAREASSLAPSSSVPFVALALPDRTSTPCPERGSAPSSEPASPALPRDGYELRLDSVRSLRIPHDFQDQTLARLLRVLSEAP